MIYAFYGLLWGLVIPYMARRFGKFMPATLAYGLYRIVRPNKSAPKSRRHKNLRYQKLVRRYFMRSFGWGIVTAALSYLAAEKFGVEHIGWYLYFIWSLLLLTEIDYRMKILPDILTIPLLLVGFAYAVLVSYWVGPVDSAIGALAGYFVPVLASVLLIWKYPDAFGGGDIKLLAALGAWLGFEKLMIMIVMACIIFGLYAVVYKKRDGAFGPAMTMAAIIVAFYFF